MIKDTVNKVLIALAAIFTVFGVLNLAGATSFLVENLDSIWAAGLVLVGVVVGLIGFFKPKPVAPTLSGTEVKSVVATILIAVGAVASFAGLTKLTDVANYLLTNLDTTYAAIMTLVGIITGFVVYFRKETENEGV